jgi:hypothetical protein
MLVMLSLYIYRLLALFKENSYLPYFTIIQSHNFNTGPPFQYKKHQVENVLYVYVHALYFIYNSTLCKNAEFSLDISYAIFPQILCFSPIFPSPWYFFPRHFKCRGIFQKYNGRWENTMSKIRSWLKIVVFYIPMLSGFIFR